MGPNEKKLREAIVTANFNPAVDRSLQWAYGGLDLKFVGTGLRDTAPKLGEYGITGETAEAANAAFLRLADEMDKHWKEMEKASEALSQAADAFWDAEQVARDFPLSAAVADPGAFQYDPNSTKDLETQKLDHGKDVSAYNQDAAAREKAFGDALTHVDTVYLQSSKTLAEVHGMEPPAEPGGTPGGGTPGGGGGYPPVGPGGGLPPGRSELRPAHVAAASAAPAAASAASPAAAASAAPATAAPADVAADHGDARADLAGRPHAPARPGPRDAAGRPTAPDPRSGRAAAGRADAPGRLDPARHRQPRCAARGRPGGRRRRCRRWPVPSRARPGSAAPAPSAPSPSAPPPGRVRPVRSVEARPAPRGPARRAPRPVVARPVVAAPSRPARAVPGPRARALRARGRVVAAPPERAARRTRTTSRSSTNGSTRSPRQASGSTTRARPPA